MYCNNCGNQLKDEAKFCTQCGANLAQVPVEHNISRKTPSNLKIIIPILGGIIVLLASFLIYTLSSRDTTTSNDQNLLNSVEAKKEIKPGEVAKVEPAQPTKANISINQIDSSNFPEIKLYFTALNEQGQLIKDFDLKDLKIEENNTLQREVLKLKQSSADEALNVNLVMDTSGSMDNGKIENAKKAALEFLDTVNFQGKDLVEVISFDDMVSISEFFTKDKNSIANAISSLRLNGQTALYDALNTSLIETSRQSGAKCVIAFTDGQDNKSTTTPNQVIELSRKLSIPIYIVGIGDAVQGSILKDLSEQTGGYFISINDAYKLKDIYNEIFKKQKEQYILTFNTTNPQRDSNFRNISLELGEKYIGSGTSSYMAKYLIDPTIDPNGGYSKGYNLSDIEKSIYNYQHSFVKAVENGSFNYWSPFIDENGTLYKQQSNLIDSYKNQGIKLKLLFFSIDSTKKINDAQYEVVVSEKFYITYGNRKPAYKDFKNTYIINKSNGVFKVAELTDMKTISDITVNN